MGVAGKEREEIRSKYSYISHQSIHDAYDESFRRFMCFIIATT